MPMDMARLVSSELFALSSGDEFKAAIALWAAAWQEVPAASIANDDRVLARAAGYGRDVDGFLAVKEMALRGFVECEDGRLYHPVVAEKALEAWQYRKKQQENARKRWSDSDAMPPHKRRISGGDAKPMLGTGTGTETNTPYNPPQAGDAKPELSFAKRVSAKSPPAASKPDRPKKSNQRTLPEGWSPREDERKAALTELKMSEAEYADARDSFIEWAGKNGRRIKDGSSPNWNLAFKNNLREYARRVGASFRKAAPGPYFALGDESAPPTRSEALPSSPQWWAEAALAAKNYDPKFWTGYASRCMPDREAEAPTLIAPSDLVRERVELRFRMIGLEQIKIRTEAREAAR